MSAINRVVKNTWILYIRMALTIFISLYATRLTLSALGVTDFGIFNLVGGVIAMLTFLNNAMSSATQRFMSFAEGAGDTHRQKEIFNVSIVLHFLIAILLFFVLEVGGYFLFEKVLEIPIERLEAAKLILQFMVVSTIFTVISVPYDAIINAHENMLFFAILGVIESILKLAIAFSLTVIHFDKLSTFGFLTAILAVFLLLIRVLYCHRKYPECEINVNRHFQKSTFKEMTSFAGWSFLGSSSSMITNYGQGIVLNVFFGPIVNASQAIANQISGQLGVFSGIMLKALTPMIAKSEGAGNRQLMLKVVLLGSKFSFFLLLILFVPVLVEMPFIFNIWLKNPPEMAIVFCRLLLIRNLIEQLYSTMSNAITAVGNIRLFQIIRSTITVFPLIITFLFFRYGFPAYSIYVVFIIYSVIDGITVTYFVSKYCGLPMMSFVNSVLVRSLSVFTLVFAISMMPYLLLSPSFSRLISVMILSLSIWIISIWIIGLTNEEKEIVNTMRRSIQIKLRAFFA